MLRKKFNSSIVDSVVGENSIFKGNIKSEGTIRVEGQVEGDVEAKGDIFIGEKAFVKGNLIARNIQLSGTVEGNIRALEILHLMSTSKLTGDIEVNSFVADEGGIFHGNCTMTEPSLDEKNETTKQRTSKQYKKSSTIQKVQSNKKESHK